MRLKKLLTIFIFFCISGAASALHGDTTPASPASEAPEPVEKAESSPPANPLQETPLIPTSSELTHNYEGAFIRMLVTLAGLIALVLFTFWFLRRIGKGSFKWSSGREISILEKRPLSPKTILYLIGYGNKKILIAESQVEMRTLATFEVDAPAEE